MACAYEKRLNWMLKVYEKMVYESIWKVYEK